MAVTLNTLRTKGGIFLTIVIMLALLAFIFSDLGSCSRNQNPMVAEINGTKIKYMDFVQERNWHEAAMNKTTANASTSQIAEEANNRAWSSLILKYAYIPGLAAMGLDNSEEEQMDMLGGVYISPVAQQYFANPNTGLYDPAYTAMIYEALRESGDFITPQYIETQINEDRLMSKFSALVTGAVFVNDLEVADGMKAENMLYDARIAFRPYSDIPSDEVTISNSEISQYYNNHKGRFQTDAYRDLKYVAFDVIPSAADIDAGRKRSEELAAGLAAAGDPAKWVETNSPDDKSSPRYVLPGELAPALREALIVNGEHIYGPVLTGETFTVSRLADTRMIPDSMDLSAIVLPYANLKQADSLLSVATPANFADMARNHSYDDQLRAQGGNIGWHDPSGYLMGGIGEEIITAPKGATVKVENRLQGVIYLFHVNGRSASSEKVRVATATFNVRPGTATYQGVLAAATDFYDAAKGSYDNFAAAAAERSLPIREARVSPTDRMVDQMGSSYMLVRNAFENKPGKVFEPEAVNNSELVVVAVLTDAVEKGTAPLDGVSESIRILLSQRKRGEILAETLTGTSLDAVAGTHSLEITDAEDIQMNSFFIPGIGTGYSIEPRLVGAISNTGRTGQLSAPVKGNGGVYVFEVTDIRDTENIDEVDQRLRLESFAQQMVNQVMPSALYQKSNIRDNRVIYNL